MSDSGDSWCSGLGGPVAGGGGHLPVDVESGSGHESGKSTDRVLCVGKMEGVQLRLVLLGDLESASQGTSQWVVLECRMRA